MRFKAPRMFATLSGNPIAPFPKAGAEYTYVLSDEVSSIGNTLRHKSTSFSEASTQVSTLTNTEITLLYFSMSPTRESSDCLKRNVFDKIKYFVRHY